MLHFEGHSSTWVEGLLRAPLSSGGTCALWLLSAHRVQVKGLVRWQSHLEANPNLGLILTHSVNIANMGENWNIREKPTYNFW